MATSLSNLVSNLTEAIHENRCKDCDCLSIKDNSIKYKYLFCNENYSNKLNEETKKRFTNTYKFSNNDINKFILLLRKGVYPKKEEFCSNLNMEDITDADYMHAKRACKEFEIKNLGQYHDF